MFQMVSGRVSFNPASPPFCNLSNRYSDEMGSSKLAVGAGCNALQERVGDERIQPEIMFPVIIN